MTGIPTPTPSHGLKHNVEENTAGFDVDGSALGRSNTESA